MVHKRVSIFKVFAFTGMAVLMTPRIMLAATPESRTDVLDRIRPVGQVTIEGQAAPAAPTPAASASAALAPAPAGSEGAALYTSRGCLACHGTDGRKTILPIYPKVAGLPAQYALNQMKDIKSGARNNGQSLAMKVIIAQISEEEMRTIAEWLSTQ